MPGNHPQLAPKLKPYAEELRRCWRLNHMLDRILHWPQMLIIPKHVETLYWKNPWAIWQEGVDDFPDWRNAELAVDLYGHHGLSIQARNQAPLERGLPLVVHRGEVQFADAFIDTDQRLVGEAALIREEQLGRGFEPLRLALVPGDQDVLLYGAGQLHRGDGRSRGGAGQALHRQAGQTGNLQQARHLRLAVDEGVAQVEMPAPVQEMGARCVHRLSIGNVRPLPAAGDPGARVPVERQRDPRLLAQPQ